MSSSDDPIICVDFWPESHNEANLAIYAHFESFSELVGKANQWITSHPYNELVSCETVEKKITYAREASDGCMSYAFINGDPPCLLKGLRLWLRPRGGTSSRRNTSTGCPLVEYMNVVPEQDSATTCESLDRVVSMLNFQLQQNPLQGSIISIETVTVHITDSEWGNIRTVGIDVDCNASQDVYKKHRYRFLRIFYASGPPVYEVIGLADIIPDLAVSGQTSPRQGGFSDYSKLMEKASLWMKRSQDVRVTNLQTVDVEYVAKTGASSINTLVTYMPKSHRRQRVLIMRIAYVQTRTTSYIANPKLVTCKTFVPEITANKSCSSVLYEFESHEQTMERVCAWLERTESSVICMQTMLMPQYFIKRHHLTEITSYRGDWSSGSMANPYPVCQIIRMYIAGNYLEPFPHQLPPTPGVSTTTCCCIL